MKKPRVSYILCVFNGEKTLRETLESLLSQKDVVLEIIAVNDGSTDGSLQILREYASKDNRIRLINQPNLGLAIARNNGISLAQGDFIASASQDDVYLPEKTGDQVDFLEKHNLDFCFTHVEIIDKEGNILHNHKDKTVYNRRILSSPFSLFQTTLFTSICSPTFLCRKYCYEQIKWNPGLLLMADKNLFLKMFMRFRGGKLEKVSLHRRQKDKKSSREYEKRYPLPFLYLEHRQSVAAAYLYRMVPARAFPSSFHFLHILKILIQLEYEKENPSLFLELSAIHKRLGFSYISGRFEEIARYYSIFRQS